MVVIMYEEPRIMDSHAEPYKLALLSCIELVLMRRGNTNYNLTVAKLDSLYNCTIRDCYENPGYLGAVLKEVYNGEYTHIVNEIKVQLDELVNVEEIRNFFKVMEDGLRTH
jgi:hypothetical protein